jgi:UDP-N-acetylglucosamine 3-dehydrogenase
LPEAAFINCVLGRILVNVELSWVTPWKRRAMTLVGSEASTKIDCLSQKIEVFRDGEVLPIEVRPNNTIRDELQHFLTCVERGERSVADAESAISAIRAIQVTQRALREKRTLRF